MYVCVWEKCQCELIYMHTSLIYNAGPGRIEVVVLTCVAVDLINQCNLTWEVSLYNYCVCYINPACTYYAHFTLDTYSLHVLYHIEMLRQISQ